MPTKTPELLIRPDGAIVQREIIETLLVGNLESHLRARTETNALFVTGPLGPMEQAFCDEMRGIFFGPNRLFSAAFRLRALNFHTQWALIGSDKDARLVPAFRGEDQGRVDPGGSGDPTLAKLVAVLPPWLETWFVVSLGSNPLSNPTPRATLAALLEVPKSEVAAGRPARRTVTFPLPNVHNTGGLCLGTQNLRVVVEAGKRGYMPAACALLEQWLHTPWNNHLFDNGKPERCRRLFNWMPNGDQVPASQEVWSASCPVCAPDYDEARRFLEHRLEELK